MVRHSVYKHIQLNLFDTKSRAILIGKYEVHMRWYEVTYSVGVMGQD